MKCQSCGAPIPAMQALRGLSEGHLTCQKCQTQLGVSERGIGPGWWAGLLGVGAAILLSLLAIVVPVWIAGALLVFAVLGVAKMAIEKGIAVVAFRGLERKE